MVPNVAEPPQAAAVASAHPKLRCTELSDERPSGIRRKQHKTASRLTSSLFALALTVVGVLCVESDRLALEDLLFQGITQVDAWLASHVR